MTRRTRFDEGIPAAQAGVAAVQVQIAGRVQGVWFRGWTRQEAERLELAGWVRNCPDGTVAAWFQGRDAAVRTMLEFCWHGPRGARVEAVTSRNVAPDPAMTSFEVLL